MKFKNNQKTSFFVYLIAFLSSFKNVNIYLFGIRNDIMIMFDYAYLFLVSLVLITILAKKLFSNNSKLDKKLKYFVPLLIWVIIQSSIVTIFTGVNYIPRNLITSFLTLFVIVLGVNDREGFKKTIWAFSIGAALSAIIPLLLYPEMIGSRAGRLNQVNYSGGFWNFTLISFISASWIIMAMIQKRDTAKHEKKQLI